MSERKHPRHQHYNLPVCVKSIRLRDVHKKRHSQSAKDYLQEMCITVELEVSLRQKKNEKRTRSTKEVISSRY